MLWLLFALLAMLCWGFTDLFNKLSVDKKGSLYSIKLATCTGLFMGVLFICLLPFSESGMSVRRLFVTYIDFAPAAVLYIVSIVISFIGLRYLELSIISPVENASGGLTMLLLFIFYLATGRANSVWQVVSPVGLVGALLITTGIVALFCVQKKLTRADAALPIEQRKYRLGALALIFPLVICLADALSTVIDAVLLDAETGVGIGQVDYLILYSLAFFAISVILWIYLLVHFKKPYNPFQKSERTKCGSALGEMLANIFYVAAIANNPVLAAPIVSAYCIVSLILSRIFLKEKLAKPQYTCIAAVVAGIVIICLSELFGSAR